MNKETFPLCSKCKWGYSERDDCVEPGNDKREYNLMECIDFEIIEAIEIETKCNHDRH